MKISESTFTIEANGFADGPAQPFRDYLLEHGAKKVIFINHPLVAESGHKHIVTTYQNKKTSQKTYRLPNKPPYTFVLDPFVPLKSQPTTAWFGFNNLAAYKGLKLKKAGKVEKVYYWAVDFVPNRFGGSPLTKLYNAIDKKVCLEADGRIELSEAARDGRTKYLGLDAVAMASTELIPMGTWLDRADKTTLRSGQKKKVVFMGHLVERQGVGTLLKAMKILVAKDKTVTADIIGGGPLLDSLKQQSKQLGLEKYVTFHGFVKSYDDVESLLAGGSVALAPYQKDPDNFTQFADPGKLKAYLGAGLPIILTEVPPNARQLAKQGAAIIVEDDEQTIATAISSLFADNKKWLAMRRAVLKAAAEFDWNVIFSKALKNLGFE